MAPPVFHIAVYGLLNSDEYQLAKHCLEDLKRTNSKQISHSEIHPLLEYDWKSFLRNKRAELRGETWAFNDKCMVFIDRQLLGNADQFLHWAKTTFDHIDFRSNELLEVFSNEEYKRKFASGDSQNTYCFMDFHIEDSDNPQNTGIGRLVFELFYDQAPETCENFRALCTGEKGQSGTTGTVLHYKDSIIHRIVPNGWVQGGDIRGGRGNGGESIYGETFPDETFVVKHNQRGILGMTNKGYRHSNGSQFYITLSDACEWMSNRFVAFGRVVEGFDTLDKLELINTINQRPVKSVKIVDCGTVQLDEE
ncbi:unnamed protein product [Rotaria socialis]|uniref:PPIase cyclophilin-type domain-containing protein n=1 Tax=Rotaria socialis TaxID=392032 RepID=A0A819XW69_9BILA|nr:unnamed protein product [Rotaria socialis]CAF3470392.1 unnamed protein product [Rotaria socialis]CAF3494212.1 unnamed protein product [Rotaria socialis]CAF4087987.1 unnamed protein product [Rotaria socialis]CAF4141290.1 unnamed protein product [Rotaria socialis]